MTHKEFYNWLDGFMTNRDWTTIRQIDIESITEKMKEVTDDFNISEFANIMTKTQLQYLPPITVPLKYRDDDDDLGKPPRIVM